MLDDKFWTWVDTHMSDDPIRLRLKYSSVNDGFDYNAAILQIECRKQFGKKLATTLSKAPRFYFPSKLAGEQSTSDLLAEYHAQLVIPDESLTDLTAGLGIDVMHCSSVCNQVRAIERDAELTKALQYNAVQSGCKGIEVIHGDCRDVIVNLEQHSEGTFFIDPARRACDGSRVFSLSECEPNVVEMLPIIEHRCRRLVVKMSPMLDITHTMELLGGCKHMIALGNATECKELIAVKDFTDSSNATLIEGVSLTTYGISSFGFTTAEEAAAVVPPYSLPSEGDYFYEPYPAVMKLNANKLLAQRFGLSAFHPNTRLYHSVIKADDFPGEVLRVERVIDYSSKYIKRFKNEYPKINVATRNFGMSAEELKKKLGVKDGGDRRVFGVVDRQGERKLIVTAPLL